jgi:phosphomannomutase / phosphoglucomutase
MNARYGVTNREITAQGALEAGRAFGARLAPRSAVGVAHDTRYGSAMLARAAACGLASAGVDVPFYSVAAAGVFALNLVRGGLAGGIYVSGGHRPPGHNGLRFLLEDGTEAADDAPAAGARVVEARDIGHLDEAFHPEEAYVSDVVQQVDARLVRGRKFRIVVDCANGAASLIAKELYEWFGCETEMLNFDPAPEPSRPADPRADNVPEARALVKSARADLGVCFDVDADRVLFIANDGEAIAPGTAAALFARDTLRTGDACVTSMSSAGALERACREAGARLVRCAEGQAAVAREIKASHAAFACEDTGKYGFPRAYPWADGLFAGARMLEVLARGTAPLAELARTNS